MTERRRFFPGTPAQQVPGRTVDLAMRLQLLPAAAPEVSSGGGGGDVGGVAWLIEPLESTIARPDDVVKDGWRAISLDVGIGNETEAGMRAIVVGATQVDWSWEIDESTLGPGRGVDWDWAGFTVTVQDGTALVTLGLGWVDDSTFRYASIVLAATQNGQLVGELSMRATLNGWAESE